MTKINRELNPSPRAWPACGQCHHAWVLRRAMCMTTTVDPKTKRKKISAKMEWIWQRDCKHKKAEVIAQGEVRIKAKRGRRS